MGLREYIALAHTPLSADSESTIFCPIGDVAEEMGLPAHVLRFWETKFHQLKPTKRRGGHRYYRPEDIALVRTIKHLLHEKGFTIKGAQKYLREMASFKTDEQFDLFRPLIKHELAPYVVQPQNPRPEKKLAPERRQKIEQIYSELEQLNHLLDAYL